MNEFDIIAHYFTQKTPARSDVVLGIGDDCALLDIPAGKTLAVSTDTLVSGIHFFGDVPAHSLGHKALAVNLSDLAAMGAQPAWVLMGLTLPEPNQAWLHDFSRGFAVLANKLHVCLVGGDLTKGPLSITCTVFGLVDKHQALMRSGAKQGDKIYVTGTLGDAALALQLKKTESKAIPEALLNKLYMPTPRIQAGLKLAELANSAIDISDGFLADLGHILQASAVGAQVQAHHLPLSDAMHANADVTMARRYALNGGDDYELCFTISPEKESLLSEVSKIVPLTCVGTIIEKRCLQVCDEHGKMDYEGYGYTHF